jgi:hypothetical protein
MAMPALSGPRSLSEISISDSIAPSLGSSDLSFKNNPTIPHMSASRRLQLEDDVPNESWKFNRMKKIFL